MAAVKKAPPREVIDVDSYPRKSRNVVIDVETYAVRSSFIDVDSYDNNRHRPATKKPKWDILDVDAYDELMLQFKNAKPTSTPKKASDVPLDSWLPEYYKSKYFLLQMGDKVYDALLTKVNIQDNVNNFYVFQVLGSYDGRSYLLYSRWGRIGTKGYIKLSGPYVCCEMAIKEFEDNFFEKTRNRWSARKFCVSLPNCYTWVEMDYGKELPAARPKGMDDPRVASFVSLICSANGMHSLTTQKYQSSTSQLGCNDVGTPAFKHLSKNTISKGYDFLKLMGDMMSESSRKVLEELSGEFYTIIPHDFGDKNLWEFVIDTPQKLRSKLEMVEQLSDVKHTPIRADFGVGVPKHPLHASYEQLGCDFFPIEADSKEFSMIDKYMKISTTGTQAFARSMKPEIGQIFRVTRKGEKERFQKYAGIKERKLLWHGSPLTNWTSILSTGLRSPSGRGTYFADMFCLSMGFCRVSRGPGVLLLCEVALVGGLDGFTLYEGATVPSESGSLALEDGVVVPLGQPVLRQKSATHPYNEYVIHKEDQIRMRYIVQVNFNS